jgi:hypothetical protein
MIGGKSHTCILERKGGVLDKLWVSKKGVNNIHTSCVPVERSIGFSNNESYIEYKVAHPPPLPQNRNFVVRQLFLPPF